MTSLTEKLVGTGAIIALLLTATPVLATPVESVPATVKPSNRTVIIPPHAVQVADHVFALGSATDPATGQLVEGFMIVDNQRSHAKGGQKGKPDNPGGGGSDTCYAFLANGAHWKTVEDYIVDSANDDGLSDSFVRDSLATVVNTWNADAPTDVFGSEGVGLVDGADTSAPDGKNEIFFADIDSPGAVAVTIVWGIFRGNPSNREIVEYDQVYDDTDFDFGDATLDPSLMDFLNVAVHETGHAAGLGHPSDSCTEESMYRFVSLGEILKRTLNAGDIAGINALY